MPQAEHFSRSGGRPFALVWSPIPLISWLMPFIGHIGICSSTARTYDFAGPFTVNEDCLLFGKPTRYLQLNPAKSTKATRHGVTEDAPVTLGLPASAAAAAAQDTAETVEPSDIVLYAISVQVSAPAGSAADTGHAAGAKAGRVGGRWSHADRRLGPDGSGADGFSNTDLASAGTGSAAGAAAAAVASTAAANMWDHRLSFAATAYRLLNYNIMTNNCHCFVAHFLNQIGYRGGGWDMINLAALMFVGGRYTSVAGFLYTWLPWLLLASLGGYFGRLVFLYAYSALCAPLLAWFLFYTWCCWRDLSF